MRMQPSARAPRAQNQRGIGKGMTTGEAIHAWRFYEAPLALQELSENGGDEDWLAEIPPHLAGEWIGWMESGTPFGCCDVVEYDHPYWEGWKIRIGCHS